jgi:hypothetical protein
MAQNIARAITIITRTTIKTTKLTTMKTVEIYKPKG